MNYQAILDQIQHDITPLIGQGKVASYIPALASADHSDFAISIQTINGESYHSGCSDKAFSIQSISKVFMYAMALSLFEESIFGRVNVEPSGNPFNSLLQLEYENGIPRNPFINPIANPDTLTKRHYDYQLHNGYMILKPFIFPEDLTGAHSATFFLEKGVPSPTGNMGHSSLHDFNTNQCKGHSCIQK